VLSRCAALVANDSGLMHLGVALGVPTFGIFGITSPARESMAAPNMTAITKGLPCEPACRRGPWGRRDCEHHLRCLRTLTADDVLARLRPAPGGTAWTI
jgi:heptosyltransferase-1